MTRITRTPWFATSGPHGVCATADCDWVRITDGTEVEATALYRAARAHSAQTGHTIEISRGQSCTVAPTLDVAEVLMRRASATGQENSPDA